MEELVRRRPAGAARVLSPGYAGYRSVDVEPAEHVGLPSPWLTLVLSLDEPLTMAAHPDPRQSPGDYDALIGGLHAAPALITHEGRQSGVQLALDPLTVRSLIGAPAGVLAGLDVPAEDVLGPRVRRLRERLLEAPAWESRFEVLDRTLAAWSEAVQPPAPEVVRAWRALLARGGRVRVDELAREVGWSARHLGVRFREDIGLTPKQAARVIRFDRVQRTLRRAPGARLSDVAATHGYYDQAHLAREFRDLAGLSPSRWLAAERIGSVQDAPRTR